MRLQFIFTYFLSCDLANFTYFSNFLVKSLGFSCVDTCILCDLGQFYSSFFPVCLPFPLLGLEQWGEQWRESAWSHLGSWRSKWLSLMPEFLAGAFIRLGKFSGVYILRFSRSLNVNRLLHLLRWFDGFSCALVCKCWISPPGHDAVLRSWLMRGLALRVLSRPGKSPPAEHIHSPFCYLRQGLAKVRKLGLNVHYVLSQTFRF